MPVFCVAWRTREGSALLAASIASSRASGRSGRAKELPGASVSGAFDGERRRCREAEFFASAVVFRPRRELSGVPVSIWRCFLTPAALATASGSRCRRSRSSLRPGSCRRARGSSSPGPVRRRRAPRRRPGVDSSPMIVKLRKSIFGFAFLDLGFDDRRQDFFREALADRALQVAELDQLDRRLRIAEDHARPAGIPCSCSVRLRPRPRVGVAAAAARGADDDQDQRRRRSPGRRRRRPAAAVAGGARLSAHARRPLSRSRRSRSGGSR